MEFGELGDACREVIFVYDIVAVKDIYEVIPFTLIKLLPMKENRSVSKLWGLAEGPCCSSMGGKDPHGGSHA